MHRRTLYENVDSAKIKVTFYTTDIDILPTFPPYSKVFMNYNNLSLHFNAYFKTK